MTSAPIVLVPASDDLRYLAVQLVRWWKSERAGNGDDHAGLHPTTVARQMLLLAKEIDAVAKETKS